VVNVAVSGTRPPPRALTIGEQDLIEKYSVRGLERGTHFGQGGAKGVDEVAGRAAWVTGLYVVTFMPNERWRGQMADDPQAFSHEVRQTRKEPLGRDHDLAEWCTHLRAFPLHEQERSPRSGTWATIRMALQLGRNVTVYVLRPHEGGAPMLQVPRGGVFTTVARVES
jgi:hypothetical protein